VKARLWIILLAGCLLVFVACSPFQTFAEDYLKLMTWNVHGYPEKYLEWQEWFTAMLKFLHPQVLCIQEIANQEKVDEFLARETGFDKAAFQDVQADGQDNAIFFAPAIQMIDLPDPPGFLHHAQAAYFRYRGLDAVIITIHLPQKDKEKRAKERNLLVRIVERALDIDPDVIVAGDFNTTATTGDTIEDLAQSLGFTLLMQLPPNIGTTYGKHDYYHAGYSYDHILVSPDLYDEESCQFSYVLDFPYNRQIAEAVSDHRPVETWFSTDMKYRDCENWPPKSMELFDWPPPDCQDAVSE